MGIVAAQCRVFIAQNDICAPRSLCYHLFLLDNRRATACSPPRRLPDSLPLSSIPPAFHDPSRLGPPLDPFPESPGEPFRCRFRPPLAFRHCISGVSCVVPAGFPLAFSMFFGAYRGPRSRNRSVRGVPCRSISSVPCRRSAPRSVFLHAGRCVSPFEA